MPFMVFVEIIRNAVVTAFNKIHCEAGCGQCKIQRASIPGVIETAGYPLLMESPKGITLKTGKFISL
jgi:hypothetical protein